MQLLRDDFKMSQNFLMKIPLLVTKIKKLFILYKMLPPPPPPKPINGKENVRNKHFEYFNI